MPLSEDEKKKRIGLESDAGFEAGLTCLTPYQLCDLGQVSLHLFLLSFKTSS